MRLQDAYDEIARRMGPLESALKLVSPSDGDDAKESVVGKVLVGVLKGNSRGELQLADLEEKKRRRGVDNAVTEYCVLCLPQPAPIDAKDCVVGITEWTFEALDSRRGVYVVQRSSIIVLRPGVPHQPHTTDSKRAGVLSVEGSLVAISAIISARSTRPSFLTDVQVSDNAHVVLLWDGPAATQWYPFVCRGMRICATGLKVCSLPRCEGAKVLRFSDSTISSYDLQGLYAPSDSLQTFATRHPWKESIGKSISSKLICIDSTITGVYDDDCVELDGMTMMYFGSHFAGLPGVPRRSFKYLLRERMSLAIGNAVMVLYGNQPRAIFTTVRSSLQVTSSCFENRVVQTSASQLCWGDSRSASDLLSYLEYTDLEEALNKKFRVPSATSPWSSKIFNLEEILKTDRKPVSPRQNVFQEFLRPIDILRNSPDDARFYPSIKDLLRGLFSYLSDMSEANLPSRGEIVDSSSLKASKGQMTLIGVLQAERSGNALRLVDSSGGIRVRLRQEHRLDTLLDSTIAIDSFYVVVQDAKENPHLQQQKPHCLLVVQDEEVQVIRSPQDFYPKGGAHSKAPGILVLLTSIRMNNPCEVLTSANIKGHLLASRAVASDWKTAKSHERVLLRVQERALSCLPLLKPGVVAEFSGKSVKLVFPTELKDCDVTLVEIQDRALEQYGCCRADLLTASSTLVMSPWSRILQVDLDTGRNGVLTPRELTISFTGVIMHAAAASFARSQSISYCFKIQEVGVQWHTVELFVDTHRVRIPQDFLVGSHIEVWNCRRTCTKAGRIVCRATYDTYLSVIGPPQHHAASNICDRIPSTTLGNLFQLDGDSVVSSTCYRVCAEFVKLLTVLCDTVRSDGKIVFGKVEAKFLMNDGTAEAITTVSDGSVLSLLLDQDSLSLLSHIADKEGKINLDTKFTVTSRDSAPFSADPLTELSEKLCGPGFFVVRPRLTMKSQCVQELFLGGGKSVRTLSARPDSKFKLDCVHFERKTPLARLHILANSLGI